MMGYNLSGWPWWWSSASKVDVGLQNSFFGCLKSVLSQKGLKIYWAARPIEKTKNHGEHVGESMSCLGPFSPIHEFRQTWSRSWTGEATWPLKWLRMPLLRHSPAGCLGVTWTTTFCVKLTTVGPEIWVKSSMAFYVKIFLIDLEVS